jgi:hypothetical protein
MTTAVAPTPWALLHTALQARQPVQICYHGHQRLLCPHALGWKAGRPILLGYQTGGHTTTGQLDPDPRKRWRCLYIDEIDQVLPDPTSDWHTADNYNPNHPFPATIDQLATAISNDNPTTPPQANPTPPWC